MATNREKYIDNASNEELAKLLASKCFITATNKITYNVFGKGRESDLHSIEKWLSQEAEEDTEHIPQIGKMPKTDKKVELTEQAYKDILARLDKLEEFTKIQMDDFWQDHYKATHNIQLSGYSYCSIEKEKTADEMFVDLGYKRCDRISWKWKKLSDKDYYTTYIWIYENKFGKWDENASGERTYCLITEAEDKAIHKKIEELKNGLI